MLEMISRGDDVSIVAGVAGEPTDGRGLAAWGWPGPAGAPPVSWEMPKAAAATITAPAPAAPAAALLLSRRGRQLVTRAVMADKSR
jgi:hypothetical protein